MVTGMDGAARSVAFQRASRELNIPRGPAKHTPDLNVVENQSKGATLHSAGRSRGNHRFQALLLQGFGRAYPHRTFPCVGNGLVPPPLTALGDGCSNVSGPGAKLPRCPLELYTPCCPVYSSVYFFLLPFYFYSSVLRPPLKMCIFLSPRVFKQWCGRMAATQNTEELRPAIHLRSTALCALW